ncbi:TetR/AcrR family transcriptional regulator [Frankia sp. CNm7]|uniref:TetR/AcrR family transcriptional regulator n=1 Tax=Frankia nepalensis TaxID=1836974 RepID=A0A937RJ48_9ACTN|nr:TetR/AcrR family transcriptional regulator [Frankia nepalensis]MBL7501086.1 TetR/AcrR family transcriptional regulator [Frankia nepalensis]MBL7514723.1 TetR/AcrR family transcriptional regulator [Frankia nepalensis]MBL7524574.1 TetR/AcrR family transcriptional regulator [Frankia nepalensis]MBL7631280.1 TetR/AcrR family transcriptional regulator [Frankia nepalensis]
MQERTELRAAVSNASRGRRDTDAPEKQRRGTGRTIRGRQTRRQLLDAAKVVFERDGFVHARIVDICDLAGISHGSFYTYFVSKEEIFNEITDSVELDLLTLDPAPEDADPIERIRLANEHYLRVYGANAKLMRVIHQVSTIDERVRETRIQRQDAFGRAIERRVRHLQEAGIADPTIDAAYAAQALGGMVAYFAEYLFNTNNLFGFDLDGATEQLTRIWTNALGIPVPAEDDAPSGDPRADHRPSG